MKHVYRSLNNHIVELCKNEKIHIFDTIMFNLWNHCAKKLEKKAAAPRLCREFSQLRRAAEHSFVSRG